MSNNKLSDKVYGVIYKIENQIDGKVYIGQTTQKGGFDSRYDGDWIKNTHNIHLKRAVEKYGKENFEVTKVLRKCYKESTLNYWESKYIKEYDSTNPNKGYNKTTGGNNYKLTEDVKLKMKTSIMKARESKNILKRISEEDFDGSVSIYKDEWNKICKLKTTDLMRFAFIVLVAYKIYKSKYNKNYLIARKSYLRKESSNDKNTDIYNEFKNSGYIKELKSEYEGSVKIELNYVDENSEILINIINFKNIITYFNELYKGWKYKECVECGKRIRIKSSNNRKKYCTVCATIVNKRKQKERNKKQKEIVQ